MTSVKSSRKRRKKNRKKYRPKKKRKYKKKSKLRYLKEGTESNGEEKSLKFSAGGM